MGRISTFTFCLQRFCIGYGLIMLPYFFKNHQLLKITHNLGINACLHAIFITIIFTQNISQYHDYQLHIYSELLLTNHLWYLLKYK